MPPNDVVGSWGSDVERRSYHDFLFRDDAWATCDRLMSYEITSAISRPWSLTTPSGGVWNF
jgi:hypothetical protein